MPKEPAFRCWSLPLIASFGMIVIGAWFWTTGLATLGHRTELGVVVHATSRSLLARYIPGSVWFAVGRVALLRKAGLPGGPLTATAVLEMALSLAAVLAFGSAILGAAGAFPGGTVWLVVVLVTLIVGSSPPIAGRVLRWLAKRRGASLTLSWSGYMRLISIAMIFLVVVGAHIFAVLAGLPDRRPDRVTAHGGRLHAGVGRRISVHHRSPGGRRIRDRIGHIVRSR